MPWVLLFDDFAHRRPFQEGSRWVPRFTNSGLLEGLKGRLFWISLQKTMVIRQDIKSFEFGTIEQCQLMLTYSFWILLYTSGRCCERISLRKKWSIFRRELARISLRWNKAFTMRKRWSQSWDSVRLLVCDLYSLQNGRFFFESFSHIPIPRNFPRPHQIIQIKESHQSCGQILFRQDSSKDTCEAGCFSCF